MPTIDDTVNRIVAATTWDERVARFRQIPGRHGTDDYSAIYARAAQQLYVPHLAPDYAYVHSADFYELPSFQFAYDQAAEGTNDFEHVDVETLTSLLQEHPRALLPLRVITGLTRAEFAASTRLAAEPSGFSALSAAKVDGMERKATPTTVAQARVAALTIARIMDGTLFGDPVGNLKSKQDKPDTAEETSWSSIRARPAGDAGVQGRQ